MHGEGFMSKHTLRPTPLSLLAVFPLCTLCFDAHAQSDTPDWTDRFTLSGDLRLRWEGIQQTGKEDNKRGRYRGRLGVSADVSEDLKMVFGLATGSDNPASRNKDFGEAFTWDDVGVDLLYADWTATDEVVVLTGKMAKPWFRAGGSSLIWDSDYNPTGVAASLDTGRFFGNAGGFLVDEQENGADSMLYTAQAGMNFTVSEASSVTAVAAFYDFTNTVGNKPFYKERAKGNSVDAEGNYIYDYRVAELSAQFRTQLGKLPLLFYGQWARNTAVSVEDTAYAFGAVLGRAREPGKAQVSWSYHDTGADAVIGTFNDSDFGGGNTDSYGHYIRARYVLNEHVAFGGTLIISHYGEFAGSPVDYDRLMLDIVLDF